MLESAASSSASSSSDEEQLLLQTIAENSRLRNEVEDQLASFRALDEEKQLIEAKWKQEVEELSEQFEALSELSTDYKSELKALKVERRELRAQLSASLSFPEMDWSSGFTPMTRKKRSQSVRSLPLSGVRTQSLLESERESTSVLKSLLATESSMVKQMQSEMTRVKHESEEKDLCIVDLSQELEDLRRQNQGLSDELVQTVSVAAQMAEKLSFLEALADSCKSPSAQWPKAASLSMSDLKAHLSVSVDCYGTEDSTSVPGEASPLSELATITPRPSVVLSDEMLATRSSYGHLRVDGTDDDNSSVASTASPIAAAADMHTPEFKPLIIDTSAKISQVSLKRPQSVESVRQYAFEVDARDVMKEFLRLTATAVRLKFPKLCAEVAADALIESAKVRPFYQYNDAMVAYCRKFQRRKATECKMLVSKEGDSVAAPRKKPRKRKRRKRAKCDDSSAKPKLPMAATRLQRSKSTFGTRSKRPVRRRKVTFAADSESKLRRTASDSVAKRSNSIFNLYGFWQSKAKAPRQSATEVFDGLEEDEKELSTGSCSSNPLDIDEIACEFEKAKLT